MTAPKPRDERKRRPRGLGPEPLRSIRVGDALWAQIQSRAAALGTSASDYLRSLAVKEMAKEMARVRK